MLGDQLLRAERYRALDRGGFGNLRRKALAGEAEAPPGGAA